MARLHLTCLVFLPFFIMTVQTAPRNIRSNDKNNQNIMFFDDENVRNQGSLDGSPKTPLLADSQPAQTHTINKRKQLVQRFPYLDDMRQNWGILVNDTTLEDEDEDYRRPINIPKPTEENTIKATSQTSFKASRAKPLSASTPSPLVSGKSKFTVRSEVKEPKLKPSSCDFALIVCCLRNANIENCFPAHGCFTKIVPSNTCQKSNINSILRKMKDYYGPEN